MKLVDYMNWNKLKSMDCPSCYKPLSKNLLGYICTAACGFQIGTRKFDQVVESLYKKNKKPLAETEDEAFDRAFDEQMAEEDEWGNPGKGENGDYSGFD